MAAGDGKLVWGSSAALTITLASLASDANRLAGRESAAVDLTGIAALIDVLVGGKIRVGTTPTTATQIDVWVYASINDGPTYPDVFDGTDSAETVTSAGIRNAALKLLASLEVDSATSDRDYWFAPRSIAALFGGVLPKRFGIFVTHNTGVALNATGGNHVIDYTPVYFNVAQS